MTTSDQKLSEAAVTARLKELIEIISKFVDNASTDQKVRVLMCLMEHLKPAPDLQVTEWLKALLKRSNIERYIDAATAEEKESLLAALESLGATDRRRYLRKSCYIAVILDGSAKDYIRNISAGGVFIETSKAFDPGKHVTLEFGLPKEGEPTKVTGTIVRKSTKGIGIKFSVVSQRIKNVIESL